MKRIGSGLDSVNFGVSSGGGVSSYNDLADIPSNVQALGAGGTISDLTVTTLVATDATISSTLAMNASLSTALASNSEGAPGSTNDKAIPTGHFSVWEVQTDNAGNTYTGLVAPATEREFTIVNKGATGSLTLSHQSASSAAANRIICPGATDLVLTSGKGCRIRYNTSTSRWRVIQG